MQTTTSIFKLSKLLVTFLILQSSPFCYAGIMVKPAQWTYEDLGTWPAGPDGCGGEHQSPININPGMVIEDPEIPALKFVNYDKIFPETITNNGHTVMLQLQKNDQKDDMPCISEGGLGGTFIFQQLHFHWGGDDSRGSEHLIDNQTFPAELHMVHYNSKYGNFASAVNHSDGIAVLAIFVEVEKRDNVAFRHIEHFEQIMHPEGGFVSRLAKPIPLEDMFPDNTRSFFRYEGSLTTPGCNEAVVWTIFDTPIALSERQLKMFRDLFDDVGHHLENNFRPPQAIHDRVVLYRPADLLE